MGTSCRNHMLKRETTLAHLAALLQLIDLRLVIHREHRQTLQPQCSACSPPAKDSVSANAGLSCGHRTASA
jgi:hypothetical protein